MMTSGVGRTAILLMLGVALTIGGCPQDTDGDGVSDAADHSPAIANPDQADSDAGGVGDVGNDVGPDESACVTGTWRGDVGSVLPAEIVVDDQFRPNNALAPILGFASDGVSVELLPVGESRDSVQEAPGQTIASTVTAIEAVEACTEFRYVYEIVTTTTIEAQMDPQTGAPCTYTQRAEESFTLIGRVQNDGTLAFTQVRAGTEVTSSGCSFVASGEEPISIEFIGNLTRQ